MTRAQSIAAGILLLALGGSLMVWGSGRRGPHGLRVAACLAAGLALAAAAALLVPALSALP